MKDIQRKMIELSADMQDLILKFESENNVKITKIESYNGDILDKKGKESEGIKFLIDGIINKK